jgi:Asp-tRNA(Asn)/Glu-tRNA(Gln) amidotransferase C subunit
MSKEERQEMIAELELITGWAEQYFKKLTDDQLRKIHKEKVRF